MANSDKQVIWNDSNTGYTCVMVLSDNCKRTVEEIAKKDAKLAFKEGLNIAKEAGKDAKIIVKAAVFGIVDGNPVPTPKKNSLKF